MTPTFESSRVFAALRSMLERHKAGLVVARDSSGRYDLEGDVGPATIAAWGGKRRQSAIPVAWVHVGKSYVSYHLMPVYAAPSLCVDLSDDLKARMQGKSCFNFKTVDERLFAELDELTNRALAVFAKAGFVVPREVSSGSC
jgi:hypothetical protein